MSEPEPNLNLENGAQVNPNQTWTAKIFWAGAHPEPEPLFETVRHPGLNKLKNYFQTGVYPKIRKGGYGGGEDPTRLRHGGLGAEPPALESLAFFRKHNLLLGLFY